MKFFIFIAAIIVVANGNPTPEEKGIFSSLSTADRIRNYGYPAEEHTVQTSDGYILTMFRIPYSPHLDNQKVTHKPVILLQHGLLSSSDCWILNGPENAMAFVLADAGYDVWMGNFRGNTYSRKNANKTPLLPAFWDFSWNEMGVYDLPAEIDYILYMTGESSLHYVGHSQGTTAFFVLLSTIPRYNDKVKTSHMLAPVGYMSHMESPLAKVGGPLLGSPTILSSLIGSNEFMPNNEFFSLIGAQACQNKSPFQAMCGNVLFLICGWDSKHLNYTLLPEVCETHPAGASTSQLIHYLQEYESGYFRRYDYGTHKNKKQYDAKSPPNYDIINIKPEVPVNFYYSDNDYFASVIDVHRLAYELGSNVVLHHVKYEDWNHLDFLWALEVKEVINDVVLELVNEYENNSY